jgi:hypothetical protein
MLIFLPSKEQNRAKYVNLFIDVNIDGIDHLKCYPNPESLV